METYGHTRQNATTRAQPAEYKKTLGFFKYENASEPATYSKRSRYAETPNTGVKRET